MTAGAMLVLALLGSLAWLPGVTEATVLRAPEEYIGPPNIRLPRAQRFELTTVACREHPVQRREIQLVWRLPGAQSLLAVVRCHEMPDRDGVIPVKDISCEKAVAGAPWQCRDQMSYYRIDFGKRYILAGNPSMDIAVPGASPDRSFDALAALLASDPRRMNGKSCDVRRYHDSAFRLDCGKDRYDVKRTCDDKGCRRTVQRR